MDIAFRVDSSTAIGTGHLVRCLTLAKELKKQQGDCLFICRSHSGNLIDRIISNGFDVEVLPSKTDEVGFKQKFGPSLGHESWLGVDWFTDAVQTINVLKDKKPDWLIVDHYALDFRWEKQLRAHCNRILVIDDLADRGHDCDLLLDQNLADNWENRYQDLVPMGTTCLLGPQYSLLQSQYAEMHLSTKPRQGPVRRVLVFFGGYDNYNLTVRTLKAFLSLNRPDISLDLVVSSTCVDYQTIGSLVGGNGNIRILNHQPSLAPLMAQADLAIGGAGSTSWERCCLGLPSLLISVAPNQIPIAIELDRLGLARYLGNHDSVDESIIREALDKVLLEKDLLVWSRGCIATVDGKGTNRLVDILELNSQTQLYTRIAVPKDETILLEWANDPAVRINAFNPHPIDSKSHRIWFADKLKSKETCKIFIVETKMGFPIGQVRFQKNDNFWEIHYSISAIARGKGLGKKVLEAAIYEFKKGNEKVKFIAKVLDKNSPSKKVFRSIGFIESFDSGFSVFNL